MASATIETLSSIRAKATANWREWAHALASTGKLPPTRDLVDAAGLLGRTVDDLERDAELVRTYNAQTIEAEFWKAKLEEIEAARGPLDDLRKLIEQTEQQLADLRDMERGGYSEGWQYGTARGKSESLMKQRPDLFGAV
jgi:hypothetical protein